MRITCPNCGAQYEVPDEVIPAEGRDVQCSNCGDTWFQAHPDTIAEAELADQHGSQAEDDFAPDDEAQDDGAPEDDDFEDDEDDEDDEDEDVPEPAPRKEAQAERARMNEIDPAVADILRKEAELEARLRASERGVGLESQGDLGLDDLPDEAARRSREAGERMARMRGAPAVAQPTEPDPGSRRGLLPDIEEINSTLRASGETAANASVAAAANWEDGTTRRKGGFRRGFILVVLLAFALVLVYANAPRLASAVPALEPVLTGLVNVVNSLRAWLDSMLSGYIPR